MFFVLLDLREERRGNNPVIRVIRSKLILHSCFLPEFHRTPPVTLGSKQAGRTAATTTIGA
jgi:hypothetical protein